MNGSAFPFAPQASVYRRPGRTDFAALGEDFSHDDLVTIPEVRDALGLFSDNSMDPLIQSETLSAISRVERLIARPVIRRTVTDHFDHWARRLELSQDDVDAIGDVRFWPKARTASQASADAGAYALDVSGRPAAVVIGDPDGMPELDSWFDNPVSVQYEAGLRADEADADLVRQAIHWLVNLYFNARGADARGMAADDRHVSSLLAPLRHHAY